MKINQIINFNLILLSLIGACSITENGFAQTKNTNRPNIILIYADDLGYSDIGCYGKEFGADFIETPNIDAFAKQSMKFTNAYAPAPLCSPSRAAMLTGKTPARLNFEFVTRYPKEDYKWDDTVWINMYKNKKLIPPPYTLNLPLEEITIAEVLKDNGYNTAIAGKWHVSSHYKTYNGWNPEFGPSKQGFEWTANVTGAWGNTNKKINENIPVGTYPADALTDKSIAYIKQQHDKPFFLYASHYYVHDPLDSVMKWVTNKYREKAIKNKLKITEDRLRFAASVELFDHYVGQLLKAVDDAGLRENTVVLFTSDNGGMPVYSYNRPFRGSKWNLYEGGIRIPLLVRYPGKIAENTICTTPVTQTDFLPTFYQWATGGTYKDKNIDGVSIIPLLEGKTTNVLEQRSLVWHFPYYHANSKLINGKEPPIGIEDGFISLTQPESAIQKNNFKLIYFYEDQHVELYNLKIDMAEQHDISSTNQALTAELKKELLAYLKKVKARLPKQKT